MFVPNIRTPTKSGVSQGHILDEQLLDAIFLLGKGGGALFLDSEKKLQTKINQNIEL